ncbi:MAG: DNA N-6-adenine-methyltransferase [Dehalococcoidales bacterium]|nr:DNA N-6-adenine-methyltransferase [Dehalococcoidales bacterium]
MNNVHYSSKTANWGTPQELFVELDAEFYFTLDPCATDDNAKCDFYFTEDIDGLSLSWDGESVFCNPPYGRQIRKWVKKAAETRGLVVMLLPARTDTSWFHDYIYGKAEIRFIRGRLQFSGKEKLGNAPFPSMVVIFRGGDK